MPAVKEKAVVKVAALGDIHYTKYSQGTLQPLFSQIMESADVLALCGDLTDYGLPEEAHVLARDLANIKIPIVGVLGNHDFESGQQTEVCQILTEAGVRLLDGDACEINGVGFAGAKGFAGGFGRGALGSWGEAAIKMFVKEAMDEAMKLESAVARLRTPQKVVLLHYSPVQATVAGEPCEIYPFLGSSRLEDPLIRYPVDVVFHGHAHNGCPEGQTANNIPVYNVAFPLMRKTMTDRPPFRLLELPVTQPETAQV
ncbi:MAG TPA: metallophosphoesterase [Chloroflexia bacterium]|nr:metallophosphoesterase [Chloroflexia bacterium]